MRIVVTGASGNVGQRVVDRLLTEPDVTSILGIARRPPHENRDRVGWAGVDISADTAANDLTAAFRSADVVIHLAWLLQPSHSPELMRATNLDGTAHVLRAVEQAGVAALVHASSLGAYSPGPDKATRVDESYPTDGIPGSLYSEQKAEAERMLDTFEAQHPGVRVARIRPAVVLQREAAAEQARYFIGRLIPTRAVRRSLLPVLPLPDGMVLQVVHAEDIADLFVRATLSGDARGAYNGAAEPVLTPRLIAEALGARRVPFPASVLRVLVDATWRLHVQPTDRGWVELALRSPVMSTARATAELGWTPHHAAGDVLREAIDGLSDKAGGPTPVLAA